VCSYKTDEYNGSEWAEVLAGRLGIELYMSVSKATPPQTLHKTFIVDLVGGGVVLMVVVVADLTLIAIVRRAIDV